MKPSFGINTAEQGDPVVKAREFQAQHRLTYPILVDRDGAARAAFRVRAFPTNVILDRAGQVRYAGSGFNRTALDATLQQLMNP